MSEPVTIELMSEGEAPKITNIGGKRVMHPEFCFVSCDSDDCENSGYTSTTALDMASEQDRPVQCHECGCEHDEWDPETVEILSTHKEGVEIEAECACGETLYGEVLAEELNIL